MSRTNISFLIAGELILFFKLIYNSDLTLMLSVVLIQLIILVMALNFEFKSAIVKREPLDKKKLGLVVLIAMCVAPTLWFHQPQFEPSTWSEAGLLIQGPFTTILILMSIVAALIAATASLYLRGGK